MAFENANLECKKIFGPLNVRRVRMDERILHTINVETFDFNTESCVEEAIFKGMRR